MYSLIFDPTRYAVCKVKEGQIRNFLTLPPFVSLTKTAEEYSFVCREEMAPENAVVEDGYVMIRIAGTLDFSLTGVLSGIAGLLAESGISIFVISTYDTDYIFVKEEQSRQAAQVLAGGGYGISYQ